MEIRLLSVVVEGGTHDGRTQPRDTQHHPSRLRDPRPVSVTPSVSPHTLAYLVTALLALIAISAVMGNVVSWGRTQIDTLRYGNPRTFQLSEAIGHDDGPGKPTHLIAMNLNRQVTVIELPGGDASKYARLPAHIYSVPTKIKPQCSCGSTI